jgi:dynein heavy chain
VQPHLKKCFEGIHRLEFKDNLDIVAMRSREGEEVKLVRALNPLDAKGAVERWLKEVRTAVDETLSVSQIVECEEGGSGTAV